MVVQIPSDGLIKEWGCYSRCIVMVVRCFVMRIQMSSYGGTDRMVWMHNEDGADAAR